MDQKKRVVVLSTNNIPYKTVVVPDEDYDGEQYERLLETVEHLDIGMTILDVENAPDLDSVSKALLEDHELPEDESKVVGEDSARWVSEENVQNIPRWEPCSVGCMGFVHMTDPIEIQKCDDCGRFKSDDEAIEAHRKECGCPYPEQDYHAWLVRRVGYCTNGEKVPVEDAVECEVL